MAVNRKQIKPRRDAAAENAARLREAFVRYLRSECHLAENTVLAYDRDLRRFLAWLANRRIEGLSISELSGYPAWLMQQELAPASVSRHVVSLKVFFRYLQLEAVLTENQAELLGTQKLWQRVPTVLSPDEIDALLTAPKAPHPWPRRDRAMLELLYATGCRVSELSTLKVRDVHWTSGIASATAKATSSASCRSARKRSPRSRRICSMNGRNWRRGSTPSLFLLLSSRGARLRRERIWELIKRYAEGAAVPTSSAPTRSATASPRTYWPAARTCDRCRKCSATPASPQRRSTPTSITRGSRRSTRRFIRGRRGLRDSARNSRINLE